MSTRNANDPQPWLYGWFYMTNSFIQVFLWNCEYLGYRIFFFANVLPKYFFNLSKDLSFPLRVNIVKSLKSYYQLSMFWHFIYKAGHHINSTSLVALPSPCPTIREVFDDGHFLLTPCSCTLFFTWAISTSAERGYSFYLHLRGCSHKTAWPGQMTPPLHPGLPGSYQSQRVCKNFFLWDW